MCSKKFTFPSQNPHCWCYIFNLTGHTAAIDDIRHIPNTSLYISFDLNKAFFISDIRNGEVYEKSGYTTTDTAGIKALVVLQNGEIYYVYSAAIVLVYDIFL